MRGFLQKDMELMTQNRSMPVIILVMTVFMICAKNESFVVSYLGMMGGFVSMSTISYDEAGQGMGYLMTLPSTRRLYVVEKYIFGYGVSILFLAFGILAWLVADIFRGISLEPEELLMNCGIGLLIVVVMLVVLVPIQLKFGTDNGRIVMAAVFMGIFGAVYLVSRVAEEAGIDMDQLLVDIRSSGIPVLFLICLVLLGAVTCISCGISICILERKEF